ncbi:TetR/AcrR family transcriptional regulator [uncultured Selenomonas sp.]|uniref:TetR/AcrR family transcriptional regulator n=1 Tax=uncultured Selenomonas sp. TaxID=159275 RepID=UPI0025EA62EF|nr:TetR/AcrR family transcriptional regulator [uncultured Selenomonas sp.]
MKQDIKQREDGRVTRERLLDCAEELTAAKGFAAVTSKEICQKAGTNLAAVNYHFGSRDGLYEAMLYRVHDRIISQTTLQDIAEGAGTPRERLERFFDMILWSVKRGGRAGAEERAIQVWLREALGNATAFLPILRHLAVTKFPWVRKLFADYLGRDAGDPVLYSGIMHTMAPILLLNLKDFFPLAAEDEPMRILRDPAFQAAMRTYAFAGLDALKKS